jgi:hypothetical protein
MSIDEWSWSKTGAGYRHRSGKWLIFCWPGSVTLREHSGGDEWSSITFKTAESAARHVEHLEAIQEMSKHYDRTC